MNVQLRPGYCPDVYLKSDGEYFSADELGRLIHALEMARTWMIAASRAKTRKKRKARK